MASDDQEQTNEEENATQQESPTPRPAPKPKDVFANELDDRLANNKKVHADIEDMEKKLGKE
ncbi:hypothetical protein [Streptomyces celluloflavus]|uniref:hypothetical protein n=1 Tax=Streptomyces celluloflavus TaxID=58344 RepID=UPI00368C5045